jgi:hypothetical protein
MRSKSGQRVVSVAIACASAPVLSSCSGSAGVGPRIIDSQSAERTISDRLFQLRHVRPKAVNCPSEMEARKGKAYRCTLTAPNGDTIGLTLTPDNDKGHFQIVVDQQVATRGGGGASTTP